MLGVAQIGAGSRVLTDRKTGDTGWLEESLRRMGAECQRRTHRTESEDVFTPSRAQENRDGKGVRSPAFGRGQGIGGNCRVIASLTFGMIIGILTPLLLLFG
ncbi:MAG: hypothetical protein IPF57_18620, partial [Gammaproteobacteria bacterium]|nr:hypothetical protein [Gammaproteobacteria bacterium]